MCKTNEKIDKFYRKIAFAMYTEKVNFWSQSLNHTEDWALGSHQDDMMRLDLRSQDISLYKYVMKLS